VDVISVGEKINLTSTGKKATELTLLWEKINRVFQMSAMIMDGSRGHG
jgi:hypothetical protein